MATTTPNYGWPVPTSTDYVKDGATAIEALGDAIDATVFGLPQGLKFIKKQTIGTGVSTVNVTGAFSTTYDAYKIIVTGGSASGSNYMGFKLGASVTGYYESLINAPWASALVKSSNSNNTIFEYAGNTFSGQGIYLNADLINPFLAKYTSIATTSGVTLSTGFGVYGGVHQVATSYTDFTLIPSGGVTLTGGTIYVYGYGTS
jgi:hypothetical protein